MTMSEKSTAGSLLLWSAKRSTTEEKFARRFSAALFFVTELHAAQTRKGTDIPYISHLMAVASLVLEHGGTADEAVGALLHDSVEDQGEHYPGGAAALRAVIEEAFGPRCWRSSTVVRTPIHSRSLHSVNGRNATLRTLQMPRRPFD